MDSDSDGMLLADVLSSKEEEISKLRKALKEKDEKLVQAGQLGNQLLQDNTSLQETIEDIQSENAKIIEGYEQEKYSLEKKMEVLLKTGAQAEQNLQDEVLRWKKKLKLAEEQANKKHAEEMSQVKSLANETSKQLQQEKLSNTQRSETLQLKEKQIAQLQKEIKQLQANLNDTLSSEVAELTNDNNNLMLKIQEMETNEHELTQMVQQLREMFEIAKKSEESMKEAKEDAERETSSYYSSLERAREECRELQAELDLLKLQPNDPNSRGNSLFAEVEDKRIKAEKMLISMKAQHKYMQSHNEQLKHYNLRLKMQISSLLETRSHGSDQEHVLCLEQSLAVARNDNGKLVHKLKVLQEKLSKQRHEEQGPLPNAKKSDESAVAQFFKHELKDRNSELERLTEELRVKEIYLMAESKKVSGLQRDLYDINRQLDIAKSANFKQQVEIDRLRMKCGEDVKVRAYKHRYKSEKIHLDTPEKDREGGSNKENQPGSAAHKIQGEEVGSEAPASAPSIGDQKPVCAASKTSGEGGTVCQNALEVMETKHVKDSSTPLTEIPAEEPMSAKLSEARSHVGHEKTGVLVDCLGETANLSDPSATLPEMVKPRHSKIRTIDRNKVTAPADCKQQ